MKNKLAIFLSIIALLVIALFWRQMENRTTPTAHFPVSNALATKNVTSASTELQQATIHSNTFQIAEQTQQDSTTIAEEKARVILKSRNLPIDFWGKVIDQDGMPLPSVKVESRIRHWDFAAKINPNGTMIKKETTTGADGQFHISGDSGDNLEIKVVKAGYALEPNMKLDFGYGTADRFNATQENPMVFKMWKTNIHEQLIVGNNRFHIATDGRTYIINLTKGTIAESGEGDIKVSLTYSAQITDDQSNNWLFEMNAVNAGIVEETDSHSSMYAAPEDNYTPTFQFNQRIRNGQRGSTGERRFYIRLKNGQEYGRITIEVFAPYNDKIPGLVDIQYAINPTGSRILR
jgi:hypothetical protein